MLRKNASWSLPDIEGDYVDQYGHIDREVYETAIAIWPHVHRYALRLTSDESQASDLMFRTVARVSKRKEDQCDIINLRSYLILVYKRLLMEEVRRIRKADSSVLSQQQAQTEAVEEQLNRTILIRELIKRMEPETREVFEQLILGLTFTEIAKQYNTSAHVLRNKFRRRLLRLAKTIEDEGHKTGGLLDE